ncbi:MAG: sigma-70 family RNA polymerase sigma factor [Bacillota bacterium]|nr:sigma-70 family RNA polymerase sigma factor [Bacillota bacterium]
MKEFEVIYEEYYSRVYAFLYKLCGDASLAEELAQETFLQAFRGFHRFRGDCQVFTWLAAIAKRVYYRYLRKNRLEIDRTVSLDCLAETYCTSRVGDPEREWMKKNITRVVRQIIAKIPPKYRDVVMLRIYGEMPFSQVAKALDITESSAKVIFFRAKKMLMEELRNEFEL